MRKTRKILGKKKTKIFPSNKHNYKSKFEQDFGQSLLKHKQEGWSFDFGYEEDKISYKLEHTYITDFKLTGANGKVIYIETKGYFKSKDRTKHKRIADQCPEMDIRFIFMNSKQKLNAKSKSTYASWCIKNGFQFADKTIPQAWLKELEE